MKRLFLIYFMTVLALSLSAKGKDWGHISASLESNNHFYVTDRANGFVPSESVDMNFLNGSIYATNNYLKVDYYKGRLSAGTQLEGYFPATVGYPYSQNSISISNLYVSWNDDSYSVTLGSFYDQLGSGLLFRSWEDRALGLNNAMVGARATYSLKNMLTVKAFYGIPRLGKTAYYAYGPALDTPFFGLGLTDVHVAAGDLSFSLSETLGWKQLALALEGSVLYRYENLEEKWTYKGCRKHNVGWSARLNMELSGLYLRGEYVDAGMQVRNAFDMAERGNAQLIELGYNAGGLGVSFTGRRMSGMTQQIYTEQSNQPLYPGDVNLMSYRPAMCTQYTYMLTTLNPYKTKIEGEVGGQVDVFYNFRRGTTLGGKRGMKVHANFSTYYALHRGGVMDVGDRAFTDFSVDLEKSWTKKFKTTLLYSLQDYNYHEEGLYVGMSHTMVADLLYKWTSSLSTRLELQYLASRDYKKDWMAGLLEVGFAPHWSVFVSDMYNHGSTGMHYWNTGVSYAMKHLRIAAGYGRYRAGYICSGGVCRLIPAYTGANLTLTASF